MQKEGTDSFHAFTSKGNKNGTKIEYGEERKWKMERMKM